MTCARIGKEAVRVRLPERASLPRCGGLRRHGQRHLAPLRIDDRGELGRRADVLDPINCAAARERGGDQHQGNAVLQKIAHVISDHGLVGTSVASPARTSPSPVTTHDTWRKDTGFCTTTVSPRPPSVMARPVAVSVMPGTLNVIVTVEPLATRMGMRTSSSRTG